MLTQPQLYLIISYFPRIFIFNNQEPGYNPFYISNVKPTERVNYQRVKIIMRKAQKPLKWLPIKKETHIKQLNRKNEEYIRIE